MTGKLELLLLGRWCLWLMIETKAVVVVSTGTTTAADTADRVAVGVAHSERKRRAEEGGREDTFRLVNLAIVVLGHERWEGQGGWRRSGRVRVSTTSRTTRRRRRGSTTLRRCRIVTRHGP